MKDKFICFHAGGVKTGSTSLQKFFKKNQKVLLSKYNIRFPQACQVKNVDYITHYSIQYMGNDGIFCNDDINKEFIKELKKFNNCSFIITNELFLTDDAISQKIKLFRDIFPEYRILCCLYVRRLDDQISSNFNQHIKERLFFPSLSYGFSQSYFEFEDICKYLLRQADNLARWKCALGEENVIVRIYDRKRLKYGSIIYDFLDFLGIDTEGLECNIESNESLDPRLLPYLAMPLLPEGMLQADRQDAVYSTAKTISAMQRHSPFSQNLLDKVRVEIEKMDKHCPGYAALHTQPALSLDFPWLEGDPYRQLNASVLYHILDSVSEIRKQQMILLEQLTTLQSQVERFPNRIQRWLLALYSAVLFMVKKDAGKTLKKYPIEFFAGARHPFNVFMKNLLSCLGPQPEKWKQHDAGQDI